MLIRFNTGKRKESRAWGMLTNLKRNKGTLQCALTAIAEVEKTKSGSQGKQDF